jgi:hypothetical protein
MILCWSFEGYVVDVSWGKSITRFFNMQVVLNIIDINQTWARGKVSNRVIIRIKKTLPAVVF